MTQTALTHLKVLDLSWHIAGPYCTKILADYGAEVIKVERPETGDPSRAAGPFKNNEENLNASGLFAYLNNNKQSITLDLKSEQSIRIIKQLVKDMDLLVENFAPGVMQRLGLDYETLKAINPKLVMVSISNFGQQGEFAHYKATEIITQAMSGFLSSVGEPNREPVRAAGQLRILEYITGTFAASSAIAACRGARVAGIGAHLDISIAEMGLLQRSYPTVQNSYPTSVFKYEGRYVMLPGIEQCKDGHVGISVLTGQHWQGFCFMIEAYDWVEDERFTTLPQRLMHKDIFQERLDAFLMERTTEEVLALGNEWRVPVTLVPTFEDLLSLDQYVEREFFVEVNHPELGIMKQPGAPFRMSKTPWSIRTSAPLLGEHNEKTFKPFYDKSTQV